MADIQSRIDASCEEVELKQSTLEDLKPGILSSKSIMERRMANKDALESHVNQDWMPGIDPGILMGLYRGFHAFIGGESRR